MSDTTLTLTAKIAAEARKRVEFRGRRTAVIITAPVERFRSIIATTRTPVKHS